jgi:signal transduction histidine kinase/PAS domain-containing protein
LAGLQLGKTLGHLDLPFALLVDTFSFGALAGAYLAFYRLQSRLDALRQAQKQYLDIVRHAQQEREALLNALPDLFLRFSVRGDYLDLKFQNASDLYVPLDQVLGRNVCDVLPSDVAQAYLDQITAVLAEGGLKTYRYRLAFPDGERHFEGRFVALEDKKEVLCLVRDITQQAQAEEVSQKRLEEIRALQRLEYELGYTLDAERLFSLVNDQLWRLTNAKVFEVAWRNDVERNDLKRLVGTGVLFDERFDLRHPPRLAEGLKAIFQGQQPLVCLPLDGQQVETLLLGLRAQGKTYGVIGLSVNLEAELIESARPHLQLLANRTTLAYRNINSYQKSQEYARRLGLIYQLSYKLTASEETSILLRDAAQTLSLLFGGQKIYAYLYHEPLKKFESLDEAPSVSAFAEYLLGIFQQASPLVLLRQGLTSLSPRQEAFLEAFDAKSLLILPLAEGEQKLAVVVLAYTHAGQPNLSEEDETLIFSLSLQISDALRRVRLLKHLRDLERLKSQIIRMTSHDLRNPLTVVRGNLEMLGDEALSPSQAENLAAALRGVARMNSLLENMLSLEKVEDSEATLQPFDILPLLDQLEQGFADQARQAHIHYQVEKPLHKILVLGRQVQMEQALSNLISNGFKYTPVGGKVTLSARQVGARLELHVQDTGYGVPEDKQSFLFQRFSRIITPETAHIEGAGLGLSLVKAVALAFGGDVFFESRLGQGSTFGFWVPIYDPNLPLVAHEASVDD